MSIKVHAIQCPCNMLSRHFASAFSIILLGPGMFSADYLIKEILDLNPDFIKSVFSRQSSDKPVLIQEMELTKSIKQKKSFDFPFSSFLSS